METQHKVLVFTDNEELNPQIRSLLNQLEVSQYEWIKFEIINEVIKRAQAYVGLIDRYEFVLGMAHKDIHHNQDSIEEQPLLKKMNHNIQEIKVLIEKIDNITSGIKGESILEFDKIQRHLKTEIKRVEKKFGKQIENMNQINEVSSRNLELAQSLYRLGHSESAIFRSIITGIRDANICLFFTKKNKTVISQKHNGFMKTSLNGIKEEMNFTSKNEQLYFNFEYDENILSVSDKAISQAREIIGKNKDGAESSSDTEKRLLLRMLEIVHAYVNRGQNEIAIDLYNKSIEYVKENVKEESGEVYLSILKEGLACLYLRLGASTKDEQKMQKAQNEYLAIIENIQNPMRWPSGMMRCYNNIAQRYKDQEKYTLAESNYEHAEVWASKAYDEDSKVIIQYNRAGVLRKLGYYEEAKKAYEEIHNNDKEQIEELLIQYELALTHLELGEYEEAIQNLDLVYKKQMLEEKEDSIAYKEKRGFSYYCMGKYNEAKREYESLLTEKKESTHVSLGSKIQTMCRLVLVYLQLENKEKMIVVLTEIQNQIKKVYTRDRREREEKIKKEERTELERIIEEIGEKEASPINNFTKLGYLINTNRSPGEMKMIRSLLEKMLDMYNSLPEDVTKTHWKLEIGGYIADSYNVQGEFERAEEEYLKTIKAIQERYSSQYHNLYSQCQLKLIEMYMREGKQIEIENYLKKEIEEDWQIRSGLGENINEQEDGQQIQMYLNRERQARVNLTYLYLSYGRNKEAEEQFSMITRKFKDPEDIDLLLKEQWLFDLTDRVYNSLEKYQDLERIYNKIPRIENKEPYLEKEWAEQLEIHDGSIWAQRTSKDGIYILQERNDYEKYFAEKQVREREREESIYKMRSERSRSPYALFYRNNEGVETKVRRNTYKDEETERRIEALKDIERWAWKRLSERRLMRLYRKQGDYKKAEKFSRYGLRLAIEEGRNYATISIRRELAAIYMDQSKYEEAEAEYQVILRYMRKFYPDGHPLCAELFYKLASVYEAQQKYDDAQRLCALAYDSSIKVYGKKHPISLKRKNKLIKLLKKLFHQYLEQREYNKAEYLVKNIETESVKKEFENNNFEDLISKAKEERGASSQDVEQNKGELYKIVSAIFFEALCYYDRVGKKGVRHRKNVLKSILREPYWANDQFKKLELAEIYDNQQRYLKIIRMYYGTILEENGDTQKLERNVKLLDDYVSFKVVLLLSKAYLLSYPEKKYFGNLEDMMTELVDKVEAKIGCTNVNGIGKAREMRNRVYLQQKEYTQFALKQHNKAANTRFRVKNFLKVSRFEAIITPVISMFGDNSSGKTVILKILHACQRWATTNDRGSELDEKISSFEFLRKLYLKSTRKEPQRKYNKTETNVQDHKDFYNKKLKNMIKYQIQSIAEYLVDRNKKDLESSRQVWQSVVKEGEKTELEAENIFFKSQVSISRNNGRNKFDVELNWEKIKDILLKIENEIVQLTIRVEHKSKLLTFYYYLAKKEEYEGQPTHNLPFYTISSTEFFSNTISIQEIEVWILKILFDSTPFVFFEGNSVAFPAHRAGLCLQLPLISKDIKDGVKSKYISQIDAEFLEFIKNQKTFIYASGLPQNTFHEYRMDKTTEEFKQDLLTLKAEDTRKEDQRSISPHERKIEVGRKFAEEIKESFSNIQNQSVVIKQEENETSMEFADRNDPKKTETAREVATSVLSLSLLNVYVDMLNWWIIGGGSNRWYRYQKFKIPFTVLYDEPEISLHPDILVTLVDFLLDLYDEFRERNMPWSLVLITHNQAVLNNVQNKLKTIIPRSEEVKNHYSTIRLRVKAEDSSYIGEDFTSDQEGEFEENPFLKADVLQYQREINRVRAYEETNKPKSKVNLFFHI